MIDAVRLRHRTHLFTHAVDSAILPRNTGPMPCMGAKNATFDRSQGDNRVHMESFCRHLD